MSKIYEFCAMPNAAISGVMVKAAAKVITGLESQNGCCRPADLVAVSRPKSAPLHGAFTWDDKEAGELWRLTEAMQIIRSIRIIEAGIKPSAQPVVRAFMNVSATEDEPLFKGSGYIGTVRVSQSKSYIDQCIGDCLVELESWRRKHQSLLTFFGAGPAIRTLVNGIKKKSRKKGSKEDPESEK